MEGYYGDLEYYQTDCRKTSAKTLVKEISILGMSMAQSFQSTLRPTILMDKWKWCVTTYHCAHARMYYVSSRNNIVYVRIAIRVPSPTEDRMDFWFSEARFSKHLEWFCSCYCYTLPPWYRHRGCLVFCSGMSVTGLPRIQSSIQPQKIEKLTSELNCHEESTQDDPRHS